MFNHIFFLFIPDFDQSTSIFCLLDNFKCQPFLFGIFSRIRMAVRGGGAYICHVVPGSIRAESEYFNNYK